MYRVFTEQGEVLAEISGKMRHQALDSNHDYNLCRMERYLLLTWESAARPIIILSKADLCEDLDVKLAQVQSVAPGVPVHAISTLSEEGLNPLAGYIGIGQTVALLGSSGVGKSTLINRLYGKDILATGDIREGDDRGKHTTTHREMVLLPGGGILIDTPGESSCGMRKKASIHHFRTSRSSLLNAISPIAYTAENPAALSKTPCGMERFLRSGTITISSC